MCFFSVLFNTVDDQKVTIAKMAKFLSMNNRG